MQESFQLSSIAILTGCCRNGCSGFNRKLERANAAVSAAQWFADPWHPNGCHRFRANDDFIVACQGETPIWFWENKDGRWELNRLCVVRESDLSDTFDLAALLDDDEDLDHRDGYRPENLTPLALLGVVMYFAKTLMHAAEKVKSEPCFPDVRDPNGGYRFREDEGLIVVYRATNLSGAGREGLPGCGSSTGWPRPKNQTTPTFQMTLHYLMASGIDSPGGE